MAPRAKRQPRVEPTFGNSGSSLLDLRLSPQDRPAAPSSKSSGKGKTRKAPAKKKPASSPRKTAKNGNGNGRGNGRGGGRSGAKRRKARRKNRFQAPTALGRFLKRGFYWSMVLGIWGTIAVVCLVGYYAAFLPPTSEWQVPARPPNVKIVAANGELLANRGDTGGEAVRLEQLPPYLPNAVIAIEDRRFRSHFGVDPVGLARAVYTNFTSGRLQQGGSTLTQQLAKNLFLEQDRTIKRKIQELVLAFWLEAEYSKDEILEMYLNRVYLGSGAYGVDAAARRYFGKSARLLTIPEAATIAGLLKAPSRYSPARNPDLAEDRAQLVLAAMNEEGYITGDEAKNALAAPAKVVRRYTTASENYAADWVMDVLPHFIGSIETDIVVDTTIDPKMQRAAEQALRGALKENREKYGVSQGAVVTLDTAGAVKALVGGADYSKSQYNRAVYAKRQPGSSFKPFVYLAALENGLSPQSIRQDQPLRFGNWSPKNYSKDYYGPVTLTRALSLSLNTVAAQLTYEVGAGTVADTAKRLGVTSDMKNNLSIALGTSEVTPLEIAGAYVPFSNGGYGVLPHVIRRIQTVDGKTLYSRAGDGRGRVIDRRLVGEMNMMMSETLLTGTGRKARLDSGRPAGGKTGTSQDFRDAWFIGYTGNLTTAVWLGNDDNSPTRKATGGGLPATVWKEVMDAAHEGLPVADLPGVPDVPATVSAPRKPGPVETVGSGSEPIPPAPIGGGEGNGEGNGERRGPLNLLRNLFGGG
ncbi:penicillin-binding protein [Stappia aggregata IAM 12614]|uniref:Penicillin-binding protein n=1 Tax=Roseibium aggregatum (strain ATCC 25650 / DSM 13394 / JCM 20685 / NBRC 16684 / NCIMB 2208 / IAM 12614 / B1) TaxID=384765 RepID=A0NXA7_ROSAI|nr:PBP1A family penicillin-binding protein [Roseibium aggregatum]EAV42434.1 penicillin-binding protein [Stappia aggregata IAM 12614] [Roseibium aggregatum IAM 12614]